MSHALTYAIEAAMFPERHVKVFKNGRNQAVRIPREFELPGEDAIMRKEGERLIIEPAAAQIAAGLAGDLGAARGRVSPDCQSAPGTRRDLVTKEVFLVLFPVIRRLS
jgi:antitoxin VapB